MNLTDYLEKWGRTIFEAPLASAPDPEEPPELAEIRLAVLDQIREKSYRSGGKKVFPFDLLRVQLRGVEESRCAVFAGKFFRKYLEQEMRNALVNAGCRYPENLRVNVEVAGGLPQRGETWLRVETGLLTVAIAKVPRRQSEEELLGWIRDSAALIERYFGRFPADRALLLVLRSESRNFRRGKLCPLLRIR